MAVLCWRLGERHFPVPYPMARLGLWLLGAAALVGAAWALPVADWWARHALHVGLTALFVGVIWLVERPRKAPAPLLKP
jgi:membrane protein implicated in regulation of membrane protease activity